MRRGFRALTILAMTALGLTLSTSAWAETSDYEIVQSWWGETTVLVAKSPQRVAAEAQAAREAELLEAGMLGWVEPLPRGKVTSRFGQRAAIPEAGVAAGLHNGVDLAAPLGTPIVAAYSGTVLHVGFSNFDTHTGGIVVIQHTTASGTYLTSYNHMTTRSILVRVGDDVAAGEQIASVGNEGLSSGPHLHFSVREVTDPRKPLTGWKILEPQEFMREREVSL